MSELDLVVVLALIGIISFFEFGLRLLTIVERKKNFEILDIFSIVHLCGLVIFEIYTNIVYFKEIQSIAIPFLWLLVSLFIKGIVLMSKKRWKNTMTLFVRIIAYISMLLYSLYC